MRFPSVSVLCVLAGLLFSQPRAAGVPVFGDQSDYLVHTWETEDGMPENSATAFAQTADGYLWFGSFGGLVRFDGVEFTKFGVQEVPELKSDGVVNLLQDARGRLWVSTYKGLAVREGGRWRSVGPAEGWTGDYARSFTARPDGEVLITTFKGGVFASSGDRLTELPPPPGVTGEGCVGAVDEEGAWWVVRNGFVGRLEGDRWVEKVPAAEQDLHDMGCGPARGGGFWLLLGKELRLMQRGTVARRIALTELPTSFWSLSEDSRGNVWIATHDFGICRVTPEGTLLRWCEATGGADHGRAVFEDREGNLWLGTSGEGLTRLTERRFRVLNPAGSKRGAQVTSISPRAAGGVWAGTYGLGTFALQADGTSTRTEYTATRGLTYIESLLEDRTGTLWLGMMDGGLFEVKQDNPQALPDTLTGGRNPRVLLADTQGRLWVGGLQALTVLENGTWRAAAEAYGLPAGSVRQLAQEAGGAMWAALPQGVFRQDGAGQFVEVRENGAPLPGITALYGEPGGAVWLASGERGLLRWEAGKLEAVPGFPGSSVSAIIGDAAGDLWLAAGRRLVRYHRTPPQGGMFHVFNAHDGVPAAQFATSRQPACARDAAGRLWFASSKGAVIADPAALRLNERPPPVHLLRMAWREPDDSLEERSIPPAAPVTLPPGSRRLEIHYTALSFTAPEKMQFKVKLDGADRDWRDAGPRRVAEYFDLAPGDYTFRVRAANNDGVWNETGAALAFTVQPHYWQTVWFRTGGVLLLLAAGGGFVWWLLRFRHARMEEKLALQQQRGELAHLGRVASLSELSGSLAHELNQPLAAILSNAQAAQRFLDQEPPDLAEVRDILTDIVAEDRRAGEVIRRMRGMLKKGETVLEPLALPALAEEIIGMIHSDLVARNVEVETEFAAALPPVHGDRIQLQQVILNLLINACDAMADTPVPGRRLRVATTVEQGRVVLTVHDRGHGLTAGAEEKIFEPFYTTKSGGLGMGLAICRSIVTAHGGRLTAQNHPDGGALLRMELPPHQAAPP